MRRLLLFICVPILLWQRSVPAQSTQPADDAAKLYESADKVVAASDAVNIMCPANSNMENTGFPYSAEWREMEKADFAANGEARTITRQARSVNIAHWPPFALPTPDLMYLNRCRELANDLGDAAVYQHLSGDDAAAVETIKDLLHMADLLEEPSDKRALQLLVGIGIQALAMDRLNVITSGAILTNDPANTKNLQVSTARDLIRQLLDHPESARQVNEFMQANGVLVGARPPDIDRFILTANRKNAERDMAAVILACHLYLNDAGNWPRSLGDLHPYLPSVPIDPFGDGKQTIGYVRIKGGLPDGSDRPLVYSRGNSKDGLFFRTDRPLFSYYNGDGSTKPYKQQKQGGQFRDVASWLPVEGKAPGATTQPLG